MRDGSTRIDIITKSYAPDLDTFRDLHASVLRHTPDPITHCAIVPARDVAKFANIRSSRLQISPTEEYLPDHFRPAPDVDTLFRTLAIVTSRFRSSRASAGEIFINMRRPWPPLRGWILQQLVKLAAVSRSNADVVITIDSDVTLVRDMRPEQLRRGETVRLYEQPSAIHDGMRRHVGWCKTARELLDAPRRLCLPEADYITPLMIWDPRLVRAMLARIEAVNQKRWEDVLASHLDVSECILYGIFIQAFGAEADLEFVSQKSLCHSYWETTPLDSRSMRAFADALTPQHVAIHVQSTSETRTDIRQALIRTAEARMSGATAFS